MALALAALGLLAGALFSVQGPINASLARVLGQPVAAAAVSFAVGAVVLLAVAGAQGGGAAVEALRRAPPHLLVGGLLGAGTVTLVVLLTPRLGAGTVAVLLVAGQLLTAVALDHFGALGRPEQALTPGRVAGAALVVAGAALIRAF